MKMIAPSILAADPKRLKDEILLAEKSGGDYIHIDVMDGTFVPKKTWTPEDVKDISSMHSLFNDVHIMVDEPWIKGPLFAKAGADNVTFHLEACKDKEEVMKTIRAIKEAGAKASISIKPDTPVEAVFPYLDELHLVLIMSVEPGSGGQPYIPESLDRIRALKKKIGNASSPLIEVDGGINEVTGPASFASGADILVSGSFLYHHPDFANRLKRLKE